VLLLDGRLLVAVSGGADSMALLHLYMRLRDEGRASIAAATFDHGLRGQAGADDALFVAETCAAWGVPCVVGRATSAPPDSGVEAWARDQRYAFLAAAALDIRARTIATAHNADDQAETVLANIIRGTGVQGLRGMLMHGTIPSAGRTGLFRPMLDVSHADLVAYCRQCGLAWREDATNDDTRFRRNWIRHAILPLLREANPDVTGALTRLAQIVHDYDELLAYARMEWTSQHLIVSSERVWFRRGAFLDALPALRSRVLMDTMASRFDGYDPDFERIRAAIRVVEKGGSGSADLGGGTVLTVDSQWVSIAPEEAPWSPPYDGYWVGYGGVWTVERTSREASSDKDIGVAVRAPAHAELTLRARRDGDRVYPPSLMGKSQKLKDWLINHKIPRQIRDHLPLIVTENKIVALWDGKGWQRFAPPFDDDTIEIGLMLRRSIS
jgi:tRNA(Ile)-lysidine synthase